MYIGPWQEFKLARILQIKDKMDKDAAEENRMQRNPVKAYSEFNQVTSLGNSEYGNQSDISRISMPISQSLNRARERQIELLSAQ
jgi:hypothetical protein